jgi:cytochrome c
LHTNWHAIHVAFATFIGPDIRLGMTSRMPRPNIKRVPGIALGRPKRAKGRLSNECLKPAVAGPMATRAAQITLVQIYLMFAGAGGTFALELSPTEAEGRAILQKNCGRCHSVDSSGESPLPNAPPFRNIYKKFAVEELKMRLSEGVVSHFRGMPQIDFTNEEITRIVDYLDVLRAASSK